MNATELRKNLDRLVCIRRQLSTDETLKLYDAVQSSECSHEYRRVLSDRMNQLIDFQLSPETLERLHKVRCNPGY